MVVLRAFEWGLNIGSLMYVEGLITIKGRRNT